MFWNHTTFKSQTSVSLPVWKVVSIQSYRCVGTAAIPKSFHKLRYFFKVNISWSTGTFLWVVRKNTKLLFYFKNTFKNFYSVAVCALLWVCYVILVEKFKCLKSWWFTRRFTNWITIQQAARPSLLDSAMYCSRSNL